MTTPNATTTISTPTSTNTNVIISTTIIDSDNDTPIKPPSGPTLILKSSAINVSADTEGLNVGQGSAVEVDLDEEAQAETEEATIVESTTPATTVTQDANTTEEPSTTISGQINREEDNVDTSDHDDGEDDDKSDGDDDDVGKDEQTAEADEDGEKPKLPAIPFPPHPRAFDKVVDSISDFAARVKSGRSRHGKMTDVAAEDEDDVDVEAENATSTVSGESDLAPVFSMHPSMIQFFEPEEPFVLICSAESADGGEVSYSWTRNGRPMNMGDAAARKIYRENAAANGNLIFISPGTGDVGTYTCLAENEHGKTYSTGSVVMIRKTALDSSGKADSPAPDADVELEGDANEGGEREPRKESVFLVFPAAAEDVDAQIVEDAGEE